LLTSPHPHPNGIIFEIHSFFYFFKNGGGGEQAIVYQGGYGGGGDYGGTGNEFQRQNKKTFT